MENVLNELAGDRFVELLVSTSQLEKKSRPVLESIARSIGKGTKRAEAIFNEVVSLSGDLQRLAAGLCMNGMSTGGQNTCTMRVSTS